MLISIFTCFVIITYAAANGAGLQNEFYSHGLDKLSTDVGFTSILLKTLSETRNIVNVDDPLLQEQLAYSDSALGRNAIANTIRNLLESFRDTVINGNDDIPPLDPLVFDHLGPYVYTYTGVRITGNVRNFRMEGLRWYVINDVTFNLLRMAVGVRTTLPWLVFTGNYDASAWIAFISHRAQGNYRVFINRIDVDVDARLGTNILGGHLLLRSLDIKIDVHDVQIHVTGMTGSQVLNNLINALVQSVTRDIIDNEMDNVSQMLSEMLFDVINEILRDFTLDDLLG